MNPQYHKTHLRTETWCRLRHTCKSNFEWFKKWICSLKSIIENFLWGFKVLSVFIDRIQMYKLKLNSKIASWPNNLWAKNFWSCVDNLRTWKYSIMVTWHCWASSGRTWTTDKGPPRAPNRSSSLIASSAA